MTNKLHCYEINPLVYSSSSVTPAGNIRGRESRRVLFFFTPLQGATVPVVAAEQHTLSQPSLWDLLAYTV